MHLVRSTLFALTVLGCGLAHGQSAPAASAASNNGMAQDAERGWFFYEEPPTAPLVKPLPLPKGVLAPSRPPPPKSDRCKHMQTWTVDCGFVDPGNSFAFQAKERDALMRAMVMNENDAKAVEQFQYYMRWVVNRSIEVANLWQYNMVQNPALDASVKAPISTFGLRLMTQVRDTSASSILGALKDQGAFLVYFSRSDCDFCQAMVPVTQDLQKATGLPIWDLTLDQKCETPYVSHCRSGPTVIKAAEALQVAIVPTLFLYVPGGTPATDAWIRIATGVSDEDTMKGRIVSFFTAYRTALLKGVNNSFDGHASVDFSDDSAPSGLAAGTQTSSGSTLKVPTQAQISALLHQPP